MNLSDPRRAVSAGSRRPKYHPLRHKRTVTEPVPAYNRFSKGNLGIGSHSILSPSRPESLSVFIPVFFLPPGRLPHPETRGGPRRKSFDGASSLKSARGFGNIVIERRMWRQLPPDQSIRIRSRVTEKITRGRYAGGGVSRSMCECV